MGEGAGTGGTGRAALALLVASGLACGAARAEVCGQDGDPCRVAAGSYRIVLPDGGEAHPPAVIFLHGLGGSGAAVLATPAIAADLTARGYAVIAPDGLPSPRGNGLRWSFRPDEDAPRDELGFLLAVRADAAARFGIDPDRVALAGFSNGAFLVAYTACRSPGSFAAYLPVAGGFWRPHPESCAGPVALFMTEGWTDATVPIEGRPLGGGAYLQGDLFETMRLFREASGCAQMRPDRSSAEGPFWRRSWTSCAPGGALEFALHPGGHTVPEGWGAMAAAWLDSLPPWVSASGAPARAIP